MAQDWGSEIQLMASGFQHFAEECEKAARSVAGLAKILGQQRKRWLAIVGGEWPDRFVLLNRYLRTGQEPKFFSDERWES